MAKKIISPLTRAKAAFNKAVSDVAAGKAGAKTRLKNAHERLSSLQCSVKSSPVKRKAAKKTAKRKPAKRKSARLKKGSAEARAYMAKIRSKRGKKKR